MKTVHLVFKTHFGDYRNYTVRDLARARRRDAVPGDGGPQQFYKGRVER